MQIRPTVSFQDLPVSPELEGEILRNMSKLERFYDRITSCRVVLSSPHRHLRQGGLYNVRIDLTVPTEEIVVNREAGLDHAHEDAHVAIRDAFKAARRRLQDHVRRERGDVKAHPPRGTETGPEEVPAAPPSDSGRARRPREHAVREVEVEAGSVRLPGMLTIPEGAGSIALFAHGSGSGRHSVRNRYVAEVLHSAHVGTLLFDLLTEGEAQERKNVFDIALLAGRLAVAARWLKAQKETSGLRLGYFGASTGAAAALLAAADDVSIGAIVSRGGRPDLAAQALPFVAAPTLLIVGGDDPTVLDLNRKAFDMLRCPKELAVVPGAGHLFEEPGTLEQVARQARTWFTRYLAPAES
jgi:dienelactone hydrolase/ribosome-associated translation inhibitor RaiA